MKPSYKHIMWLLVLGQSITVLLMAIGVWPLWVVWINFGASALYILISRPYYGLLFFIASMAFYVALPNDFLPSLSMWRPLVALLFIRWLAETYRQPELIKNLRKQFFSWDRYALIFLVITFISLILARFPGTGLKQILFLINAYLLYVVVINVVKSREQVIELIKYGAISAGIILALGYIQFIITFFTPQYYFWQYWAIMVSRLYYGLPLANVLIYSNSWFSYIGDEVSLRMFSIMPDSHSFGVVSVFFIMFTLPFLAIYRGQKWNRKQLLQNIGTKNYFLWYAVRFAGLAIVLSGTRGLWVGMLAPLFLSVLFYFKRWGRVMMKKTTLAFGLIILLFVLSPFINLGLSFIRLHTLQENFLDRAASIYDLSEASNVGRLVIWGNSLKYALSHPLGTGYGNFIVSVVKDVKPGDSYASVADEKNLRYNLPQKFVTAHSLYLNILVELGIAGLLAFLLFWSEYAYRWWLFYQKYREEFNIFTFFVVAAGLSFVWILAYGVFDVTLFNDKVLLYFFIALGLSGIILRNYASRYRNPTNLQ